MNEAKLILIGEGEVGKSCLLGALRGDNWVDGRPTTHGIEIKSVVDSKPNQDTTHCTGIAELKEAIARIAASLPEMGRSVPAKWQRVQNKRREFLWVHPQFVDEY